MLKLFSLLNTSFVHIMISTVFHIADHVDPNVIFQTFFGGGGGGGFPGGFPGGFSFQFG